MGIRKFLSRTVSAAAILAAAGCADGTGQALTPTLPSVTTTTNADGTVLKASPPQPLSPRSAARVTSLTPVLVLQNGAASFDSSADLSYVFELFEGTEMIAKSDPIPAAEPQTTWTVPANLLKVNKTYAWRAYAYYDGAEGSLSDGVSFRTPIPPPTNGPVACAGNTGHAIIACVAAAFPERLVPTSNGDFSDERRFANMEFIRDRIIETGRCKGLDLGLNRKRGTEVISRDFIVYRGNRGKGGRDMGVDIASGYDATQNRLKLTWQLFDEGPNYGHPFYKDYGPVDCSLVQ